MTDKVLSGTSKDAWDFLKSHWKGLANVTLLPFSIYFAVSFLVCLAQIFNLRPSNSPIPIGNVTQWNLVGTIGDYSTYAILIWLSLTASKYYNAGKPTWTGRYTSLSKDVFLAFVYVAVCFLISSLAMLPAYLVDNFFVVENNQGFSFSVQLFVGTLLHFLVVVASLVLTLYLFCRSIVGLRVVFRDGRWDWKTLQTAWASTKSESFGLPLRLVAWALLTGFGFGVFAGILHLFVLASQMEGKSWISLLFSQANFGLEIAEKLLPIQMALIFFHLPIVWFFSLLLAVSSARFMGQSKASDNEFAVSDFQTK